MKHHRTPFLAAAAVALLCPLVAPYVTAQEAAPEVAPQVALEVTEENARSIDAYNAAIIAAQEGRLVESIARLEAYIAAGPPEALKLKAGEQLTLIRAERAKQHTVDFNAAVAMVKKKRFEPAAALLRGILADGPTDKMRRSVEKQLGVIGRARPMLIVPDEPGGTSGTKKVKKKKDRAD